MSYNPSLVRESIIDVTIHLQLLRTYQKASTNAYLPILKMLRYSMKLPPQYTKAGCNRNLQFDRTCTYKNSEKNKTRKRKTAWLNPPFKFNVATNVAKTFLALIGKQFTRNKRLSKIFNRNTIKFSYSCLCTQSPKTYYRLLQLHRMKESTQDSELCNCRQKSSCPLDGKCLTKCVVYKATVTETTSNN